MTDGAPAAPDRGLGEMLDYETLLAAESDDYPWPKISERMAASMCYTSGTTGNPKGVVYSHRSQFIHTMGVLQADNLGITERDTVLPIVPMFHANSWGLPYACGWRGARCFSRTDSWATPSPSSTSRRRRARPSSPGCRPSGSTP